MADKSLYDILEVSPDATPAAIRVAYERLVAKYRMLVDTKSDDDARIKLEAVRQAFLILDSPEKRIRYDNDRLARMQGLPGAKTVPVSTLWSGTTMTMVLLLLISGGGYYYHKKQVEQKITEEREAAKIKAREAAEQARITEERQRAMNDYALRTMQRQQSTLNSEERTRREHEIILQQHATEQQRQSQRMEYETRNQIQNQRRTEEQKKREEQQAAAAAQAQLAREKAELCRIERERYGRALSC